MGIYNFIYNIFSVPFGYALHFLYQINGHNYLAAVIIFAVIVDVADDIGLGRIGGLGIGIRFIYNRYAGGADLTGDLAAGKTARPFPIPKR